MITEWYGIDFPKQDGDRTIETNQWGRQQVTWKGYELRRAEAVSWCSGTMIHGRFAFSDHWDSKFYFKSKKDAMAFKLSWGGQ